MKRFLIFLQSKTKNINIILFSIVIFFIRLPNIYIIPIKNPLFLTNNLVRLNLLIIFILSFLTVNFQKKFWRFRTLIILILVYFLSQSLSILSAINLNSFFTVYKDLIFAILLFLITLGFVDKKNINFFLQILILATLFNVIYQTLFHFLPYIFLNIFQYFFNERYFEVFNFQYQRNRFFGDSLDEAIIPLIIYFIFKDRNTYGRKITLFISLFLLLFVVLFSNWRTKALILLFSLTISFFLYLKEVKKHIIIVTVCIFLIIYSTFLISNNIRGKTIVNRLFFSEDTEPQTTQTRINYWKEAVQMGISSPIIGVGLGNYYDNLSQLNKEANKTPRSLNLKQFILVDDPHNLFLSTFASSGFLGFATLFFLIAYLLKNDFISLKDNNRLLKTTIFCFWGVFLFAVFNPWLYYSYQMTFWLLRGMVEKLR